jgi:6-phosphogluconolactonase
MHPVQTEENTLEQAAKRYEDDIVNFFNIQGDTIPEFDLIMLGIGEDGHTASLFPGTQSLKEKRHLTIPVIAVKAPHKRISLTLPVLNKAKHIIFLVSGENKTHAVKEMLESKNSKLPAALVKPENGSLLLVIDEAAASLLTVSKVKR